jgi:hypothetical protein
VLADDGSGERREPLAVAGRQGVEQSRQRGVGLCGEGSVTTGEIVAQLPALAAEITAGTLTVAAASRPLDEVEAAWNAPADAGQRIVFTP